MIRRFSALAIVFAFVALESRGKTAESLPLEGKDNSEPAEWECALSIATYLAQNERDYANPTISADHDWLHLEVRYNYESLKTGSVWLGYNFSIGEKVTLEATPMFGGVFGDVTGFAPGYSMTVSYKALELITQGEYFVDAAIHAGNFFYTWSELSLAPASWFRFGIAVDRTKALGDTFDIRRGPLIGFKYKNVDLTTYWLSPGSHDGTFIFATTVNF